MDDNHKLYNLLILLLITPNDSVSFLMTVVLYCIVSSLFSNMGDKTHPFTISLYNTFMKQVRVETAYKNKSTTKNRVQVK